MIDDQQIKRKRIAVVGGGLLGASFALACAKRIGSRSLTIWDRDPRVAIWFRCNFPAARVANSLDDCVKAADVVLLAVPPHSIQQTIADTFLYAPVNSIVTDVCSVKQTVCDYAYNLPTSQRFRFVPAHPIAGGSTNGPEAASADLFVSKAVVICPLESAINMNVELVAQLWHAVGATTYRLAASQHDQIYASVSHLPHLLAFAFASSVAEVHPKDPIALLSGKGFADFSRNAAAQPELWTDICMSNRHSILKSLDAFTKTLDGFRRSLIDADTHALSRRFALASAHHRKLTYQRN
ncbi:MAG: prephenate dehydrogenase [Casimicrobium sp.]